ncbi:hypothetical protein V8G54_034419, partial [Vigna mungo]
SSHIPAACKLHHAHLQPALILTAQTYSSNSGPPVLGVCEAGADLYIQNEVQQQALHGPATAAFTVQLGEFQEVQHVHLPHGVGRRKIQYLFKRPRAASGSLQPLSTRNTIQQPT